MPALRPRKSVLVINLREALGLTDGLGYPLCQRCRARLDEEKCERLGPEHGFGTFCVACAELVVAEQKARWSFE